MLDISLIADITTTKGSDCCGSLALCEVKSSYILLWWFHLAALVLSAWLDVDLTSFNVPKTIWLHHKFTLHVELSPGELHVHWSQGCVPFWIKTLRVNFNLISDPETEGLMKNCNMNWNMKKAFQHELCCKHVTIYTACWVFPYLHIWCKHLMLFI